MPAPKAQRRPSDESYATTSKRQQQPRLQQPNDDGCGLLPHGGYSLLPTVLATMGWLSALLQNGCDYSRLSGSSEAISALAVDFNVPWLEVGFLAYREPRMNPVTLAWETSHDGGGTCTPYPDDVDIQDVFWLAAKSCDFVGIVLGGAGALFLWFSGCCVFSRGTWRWAGYGMLLAALFQGASFVWFATSLCQRRTEIEEPPPNCTLFWGSKMDIVATVFWFLSSLFILCKYPVPKDRRGGDGLFLDRPTTRPSVVVEEVPTGAFALEDETVPGAAVPPGSDDEKNYKESTQDAAVAPRGLSDVELS